MHLRASCPTVSLLRGIHGPRCQRSMSSAPLCAARQMHRSVQQRVHDVLLRCRPPGPFPDFAAAVQGHGAAASADHPVNVQYHELSPYALVPRIRAALLHTVLSASHSMTSTDVLSLFSRPPGKSLTASTAEDPTRAGTAAATPATARAADQRAPWAGVMIDDVRPAAAWVDYAVALQLATTLRAEDAKDETMSALLRTAPIATDCRNAALSAVGQAYLQLYHEGVMGALVAGALRDSASSVAHTLQWVPQALLLADPHLRVSAHSGYVCCPTMPSVLLAAMNPFRLPSFPFAERPAAASAGVVDDAQSWSMACALSCSADAARTLAGIIPVQGRSGRVRGSDHRSSPPSSATGALASAWVALLMDGSGNAEDVVHNGLAVCPAPGSPLARLQPPPTAAEMGAGGGTHPPARPNEAARRTTGLNEAITGNPLLIGWVESGASASERRAVTAALSAAAATAASASSAAVRTAPQPKRSLSVFTRMGRLGAQEDPAGPVALAAANRECVQPLLQSLLAAPLSLARLATLLRWSLTLPFAADYHGSLVYFLLVTAANPLIAQCQEREELQHGLLRCTTAATALASLPADSTLRAALTMGASERLRWSGVVSVERTSESLQEAKAVVRRRLRERAAAAAVTTIPRRDVQAEEKYDDLRRERLLCELQAEREKHILAPPCKPSFHRTLPRFTLSMHEPAASLRALHELIAAAPPTVGRVLLLRMLPTPPSDAAGAHPPPPGSAHAPAFRRITVIDTDGRLPQEVLLDLWRLAGAPPPAAAAGAWPPPEDVVQVLDDVFAEDLLCVSLSRKAFLARVYGAALAWLVRNQRYNGPKRTAPAVNPTRHRRRARFASQLLLRRRRERGQSGRRLSVVSPPPADGANVFTVAHLAKLMLWTHEYGEEVAAEMMVAYLRFFPDYVQLVPSVPARSQELHGTATRSANPATFGDWRVQFTV